VPPAERTVNMKTNMEVVRILDEMSSLGLKLSEAWEKDGNRDGDLFSTMPFPCSLDEWPFEVEQLAREYGSLPEDHNDDLNPGEILEELVAQMGGEPDRDNVVQAVAIQRAQAYLKRASWTPRHPAPNDGVNQTTLALLMKAMDALKSATYQSQTHLARKIDAHLKSLD